MVMDIRVEDLTPEEQEAVKLIGQRMGVSPAGVMGGNVVDASGNVVGDLDQWKGLVHGVATGQLNPDQITSGGRVIYGNNVNGTGLAGAEKALEAGTTSALSTLGQGAETARSDLTTATTAAQRQLNQGNQDAVNLAVNTNDLIRNQMGVDRYQIADTALKANDMAQQALLGGRQDVLANTAFAQEMAAAPLQGYTTPGQMANDRQAALAGTFGSEAQQEAFADFNASPDQQYLRDQQEKALLRNSAAIGGLGGANVRKALQEQAAGIASQDYNNYYNRLSDVANRGVSAGQSLSTTAANIGNNASNLLSGFATQGAGITGSLGGNVVSQFGGIANNAANITGNLGNNVMNQWGSNNQLSANMTNNTGQNLANIAQNTGLNAANLLSGAGNNMANYRYDTGVNLANTLTNGSNSLANMANNSGIAQADLMNNYTTGLANLLSGTGGQLAASDQALATLIANIATGAGSQYSSLPGIPGVQAGNDHITSGGNLLSGIGAGAQALQGLM